VVFGIATALFGGGFVSLVPVNGLGSALFWREQPEAALIGGGGDSGGGEIDDGTDLGWGGGGLPTSPPCSLIIVVC
jgi:hypothetical protein